MMTISKSSGRVHSALVVRRSLHGHRFATSPGQLASSSSSSPQHPQTELSSVQTVLDSTATTSRRNGGLDRMALVQILDEALSIGAATLAEQPKLNGTDELAKRPA
jgi:hypothetical protein